jgi:hypothetical protein
MILGFGRGAPRCGSGAGALGQVDPDREPVAGRADGVQPAVHDPETNQTWGRDMLPEVVVEDAEVGSV